MMRWGRKKSSPASSSRPSFISHVSLLSWLSKFKRMRVNTEPSDGKVKQKGKLNSLSVSSSQYACGLGGGVSHGGDDDGFYRIPFGEESHERKRSKDILETELSNLDDDLVIPVFSCNRGGWNDRKNGRKEGTLKLKEKEEKGTVAESKFPKDSKISMEMDDYGYNREKELEKLRRTFEKKAQQAFEKATDKAESASTKSEEKYVLQLESPRAICTPRKHSFVPSVVSKNHNLRSIKTESRSSEEKLGVERQHSRKNETKARKPKHSSKVRVYSPRVGSKTEICKIKALEDLKKAKLKTKKAKERMLEKTEVSDSFAVVRCSLNPEKDFRDSMVEMITELHIHQPEEYEELLTCYLTLNSDEYHDLIIKVFREVWFDMNRDILGISLHRQFCQL
ncbi:transcription repressor OFP5-like [Prosopis cineraria]|uniref:transcription repressor OFP5-like n=1 Tax=Prosopis cineraria TaxID=364024 RepID=UPI00240FCBDA|nr:transcription repressor OFP5-like [Prosopis cineraria]